MKIAFRTEGNAVQGMGDVWGSLALAHAFKKKGDLSIFVLSTAEAQSLIQSQGFAVKIVKDLPSELATLQEAAADILVFNKLNNKLADMLKLKSALSARFVTIDDNGPAAQEADLRINLLYHTPNATSELRHMFLRDEFQRFHEHEKRIRPTVEEILVMQGGSDTHGFLPLIVQALSKATLRPHYTIVTGPEFKHDAALKAALETSPISYTLRHNVSDMVTLMWEADMAISAGGISMYELACVGTPSLIVGAETFESESALRLEKEGAVIYVGYGGTLVWDKLSQAIDGLALQREKREQLSAQGKRLLDGRGAERVVELIRRNSPTHELKSGQHV